MASCVKFSLQAERYTQLLEAKQKQQSMLSGLPDAGPDSKSTNTQFEAVQRSLAKMEEGIRYHMKLLLDALNFFSATETVQFLCLVARLDFNRIH